MAVATAKLWVFCGNGVIEKLILVQFLNQFPQNVHSYDLVQPYFLVVVLVASDKQLELVPFVKELFAM